MARTEGSIEVDAEPGEVMAVLLGFEAYPEWAGIRSIDVIERDGEGRGSRVAMEVSASGFDAAYTLAYSYAPDDRGMSWTTEEAEGAVRGIVGEYELAPEGDGTRVTYRLEVELSMPLPGFMRRQAEKRIVKTALEGLKRRVELG